MFSKILALKFQIPPLSRIWRENFRHNQYACLHSTSQREKILLKMSYLEKWIFINNEYNLFPNCSLYDDNIVIEYEKQSYKLVNICVQWFRLIFHIYILIKLNFCIIIYYNSLWVLSSFHFILESLSQF